MESLTYRRIVLFVILIFTTCNLTALPPNPQPVERIYVHVQRNEYIAGEAVWYKVYCWDNKTQKLSQNSNVAYIELIDENGNPVIQNNIILKNGMGHGGFQLSPQLATGNYSLNAYTHWMNTTSKELIHVTPLFVFNNQNLTLPKTKHQDIPPVKFCDLKKNEIVYLSSNHATTPEKEYILSTKIVDLNRILQISITCHKKKGNGTKHSIEIHGREGKVFHQEFEIQDTAWKCEIPLKDLRSPNYGICIRNSENQIVKMGGIHLTNQVYQKIDRPIIKTGKRRKLSIKLDLKDFSKKSIPLNVSASVSLKAQQKVPSHITEYKYLYSDFPATKSRFFPYLEKVRNTSWVANDLFTPLWIAVDTSYDLNANRYIEHDCYVLEGKARYIHSKKAYSDQNVYLSKIGAYADISPFRTNPDGKFYFSLPLERGLHDISLQVKDQEQNVVEFQVKNKHNKTGIAPPKWNGSNLKDQSLAYIKKLWECFKIRKIYKQSTHHPSKDTVMHRAKCNFFGQPNLSVKVANYIQLDSLEEYFHEFISPVKIKYRRNKCIMNIFSPDLKSLMKPNPLILFDGIILSDPTVILRMPAKTIAKIEVVPYEYYHQTAHHFGIIHVISNTATCQLSSLPNNTQRYYLPLFSKSIQPTKLKQENKNFTPDCRTDLLWVPNIRLSKDSPDLLEFTTSDVTGEFQLIVEGIYDDGTPFVLKQDIWVE